MLDGTKLNERIFAPGDKHDAPEHKARSAQRVTFDEPEFGQQAGGLNRNDETAFQELPGRRKKEKYRTERSPQDSDHDHDDGELRYRLGKLNTSAEYHQNAPDGHPDPLIARSLGLSSGSTSFKSMNAVTTNAREDAQLIDTAIPEVHEANTVPIPKGRSKTNQPRVKNVASIMKELTSMSSVKSMSTSSTTDETDCDESTDDELLYYSGSVNSDGHSYGIRISSETMQLVDKMVGGFWQRVSDLGLLSNVAQHGESSTPPSGAATTTQLISSSQKNSSIPTTKRRRNTEEEDINEGDRRGSSLLEAEGGGSSHSFAWLEFRAFEPCQAPQQPLSRVCVGSPAPLKPLYQTSLRYLFQPEFSLKIFCPDDPPQPNFRTFGGS